jgi:hypothetical protein
MYVFIIIVISHHTFMHYRSLHICSCCRISSRGCICMCSWAHDILWIYAVILVSWLMLFLASLFNLSKSCDSVSKLLLTPSSYYYQVCHIATTSIIPLVWHALCLWMIDMYLVQKFLKCGPQHFSVPCSDVQVLKILPIFSDIYFLRYGVGKYCNCKK